MGERRKSKRWLLNKYYEAFSDYDDDLFGYLSEVSTDGLMTLNDEPVETNIVLPLRITVNEDVTDRKEIKVVAKVVRCQKDQDIDRYNTGFKLVDATNEAQEILNQLVKLSSVELKTE